MGACDPDRRPGDGRRRRPGNGWAGDRCFDVTGDDWLGLNRANWDERVPIHLQTPRLHYQLDGLKAGAEQLDPIAAEVLGPVDGLHVLHLLCLFGADTLTIAQHGAVVTGLDFSPPAIVAARALAIELCFAPRSRFVEAYVYDAPGAGGAPAGGGGGGGGGGARGGRPD